RHICVKPKDLFTSYYRSARRKEFTPGITGLSHILSQNSSSTVNIPAQKAIQESLQDFARALLQSPGDWRPGAVVGAHAVASSMVCGLDVRLAHIERFSGFSDRVIEDITQQQHRSLRRSQCFESHKEGIRDTLEELVACGGIAVRIDRLKRGNLGFVFSF